MKELKNIRLETKKYGKKSCNKCRDKFIYKQYANKSDTYLFCARYIKYYHLNFFFFYL